MIFIRIAVYSLLTLLISCSGREDIQLTFTGKTFNHLFFETEQECIESQPNPDYFSNCGQQLTFIDDTQATIILTDIVNAVTYSVDKNMIVITPTSGSEFSDDIVFEIIGPGTLMQVDNDSIWKEQLGDSIWD